LSLFESLRGAFSPFFIIVFLLFSFRAKGNDLVSLTRQIQHLDNDLFENLMFLDRKDDEKRSIKLKLDLFQLDLAHVISTLRSHQELSVFSFMFLLGFFKSFLRSSKEDQSFSDFVNTMILLRSVAKTIEKDQQKIFKLSSDFIKLKKEILFYETQIDQKRSKLLELKRAQSLKIEKNQIKWSNTPVALKKNIDLPIQELLEFVFRSWDLLPYNCTSSQLSSNNSSLNRPAVNNFSKTRGYFKAVSSTEKFIYPVVGQIERECFGAICPNDQKSVFELSLLACPGAQIVAPCDCVVAYAGFLNDKKLNLQNQILVLKKEDLYIILMNLGATYCQIGQNIRKGEPLGEILRDQLNSKSKNKIKYESQSIRNRTRTQIFIQIYKKGILLNPFQFFQSSSQKRD
jgi:septal ring factor EnvC (AmiA/AmiB activator)